ncbi:Hypothetical/unknown protein [Sinorhizobium meliloti 1021]|uniref:Uncharacterized protein n=1 Tax=Rhizobium meliloti (strain 1021) TaxID=266834 RepID=Q92LD6_RHIME|nr:Hypothetical protein SM2011_c03284 [Sinorhizobium meliloti 2011]CAC47709.1 Hypothetical/unknown protein [Sinorhizobium meliloti 1021]
MRQYESHLDCRRATGDIIAPIRKLGEAKRKVTSQDAADVAEALVNIRTYFMPKRAKQKF